MRRLFQEPGAADICKQFRRYLIVDTSKIGNRPWERDKILAQQGAICLRNTFDFLGASFIPPPGQRELRDLTRQRANLVRDRTQTLNRLQKILEDANIKLGSVVSDINGASALDMLRALASGATDPTTLAGFARGRLRAKKG